MILDKKTKIVCTIGPATQSQEKLEQLLKAGMTVARLNFSHGDFAEHQLKVDNLKKAMKKTGIAAAVMQDLSGPKFRLGDFYQERVELKAGDFITLTTEKITGDEKRVSVNYPTLHEEIEVGNIIMVDDGKKKFEVVDIKGTEIKCKILVGGNTKGRRSLNLPGAKLKIGALTDKDKKDIEFGLKNKVDIVAFSFIRKPSDVVELRDILNKAKSKAKIMAKIETIESIDCFDEILELVDMVMVARGDLATEYGYENVPPAQKMMIEKCNQAGKPVVTATQMMESMIKNPFPTRGEVSDVANAIYDGTDAVMLSEETTLGDFPVETVAMMTRIAQRIEADERFVDTRNNVIVTGQNIDLIAQAAVDITDGLDPEPKFIVAITETGDVVRALAGVKPTCRILVATSNVITHNQVTVSYGAYPILVKKAKDTEAVVKEVRAFITKNKLAAKGDSIVVVDEAGMKVEVDTI